ncbi:MAG: methyltransferase [Bryobacteraceae bacterium]
MLPEELMERINAFQESRVLLTAIELDLFNAVGAGAPAEEVARRLGAHPRSTEMLMNALVALGMLEKQAGMFRNSETAARYFTRGSPEDARLATMHQVARWQRWNTLTECVRAGTSVLQEAVAARGAEGTEAFIAAMHQRAGARTPEVVRAVGAAGVKRMLDLGGGSGAYSIAFAQANPELRAEILDLELVVGIARRHIEEAGLSGRITARVGDLRKDAFGGGYDLVLISAICHMLGAEENRDLLRRSFAALAPGGRAVIQDFILGSDRTGPRQAALFALNMLVATREGNTYTEQEYWQWLREAGFAEVRRVALRGPTDLIVGTRAA